MSSQRVKATKLKSARTSRQTASTFALSQRQSLVDEESHTFRLGDTTSQQGSTIFTVFHNKESKLDIEKRVKFSRQPVFFQPSKRIANPYLYRDVISLPLRPVWNNRLSREEVQQQELAKFEEYLDIIYKAIPPSRLTHFEHNLDVWRQLWRVCELSDILCVTVDSRYPLFHLPPALYSFIVHKMQKPLFIILNKIDLVPSSHLAAWKSYLERIYPSVHVVFFTSHPNPDTITAIDDKDSMNTLHKGMSLSGTSGTKQIGAGSAGKYLPVGSALLKTCWNVIAYMLEDEKKQDEARALAKSVCADVIETETDDEVRGLTNGMINYALSYTKQSGVVDKINATAVPETDENTSQQDQKSPFPSSIIVTDAQERLKEQIISKRAARRAAATIIPEDEEFSDEGDDFADEDTPNVNQTTLTIGMVGHPNAGKSSLINALLGRAAVSVSSAPGHTKHLQTLCRVPNCPNVRLCDCPGLVFPAVDISRSLQTVMGIYPYTKLSEPYTCVQFLAERLPIVSIYNLKPFLGPDSDAALHGASKPGGNLTALVENYLELQQQFRGRGVVYPQEQQSPDKYVACVLSTDQIEFNIYKHGVLTTALPEHLNNALYSNNAGATSDVTPAQPIEESSTPAVSNSQNTNLPPPPRAIIPPPPKFKGKLNNKNNKTNNTAAAHQPIVTKQKTQQVVKKDTNIPIVQYDVNNEIDLASTLDNLLAKTSNDVITNPRYVWSAYRICESFAVKKGWYTEMSGMPDTHKAGMTIVKDCVDGRLNLWFLPPVGTLAAVAESNAEQEKREQKAFAEALAADNQ